MTEVDQLISKYADALRRLGNQDAVLIMIKTKARFWVESDAPSPYATAGREILDLMEQNSI